MPRKCIDRFVPGRIASSDDFRANKDPRELSTPERLLRTDQANSDAFCFNSQRSVPSPPRRVSRSECVGRHGTVIGLNLDRQVSHGAVWSVGGTAPGGVAVEGGSGRLLNTGTNAPLYNTSLGRSKRKSEETQEKHEDRLAAALGLNRAARILDFSWTFPRDRRRRAGRPPLPTRTNWTGTEWSNDAYTARASERPRVLPAAPFKVLDAPGLRDDFYCSVMDYSRSCNTLAIGLGNLLYGWSEASGVSLLNPGPGDGSWLTAVAFSSEQGRKSILAFGRSNGSLSLMSLFDGLLPRFEATQPAPVACASWSPTVTLRESLNPRNLGAFLPTESLLVGDEVGDVYFYSVEWPDPWEASRDGWQGAMTLLVKIKVHAQQVCGLAWSPTGMEFATGGNDNICCLFQTEKVVPTEEELAELAEEPVPDAAAAAASSSSAAASSSSPTSARATKFSSAPSIQNQAFINGLFSMGSMEAAMMMMTGPTPAPEPEPSPDYHLQPRTYIRELPRGSETHRWEHAAAVKAIAFCPWRPSLIATGGGSNDKCIHFFHTTSGTALSSIAVAAQVTSLTWSTTRREIAATFGYTQPDHPYRIAVFSWPECRQVAAIPWEGEHRALYAVAYPRGPSDSYRTRDRRRSRTAEEGCLVVAGSDQSVKFHEVWLDGRKATALGAGVLAGSDILEMQEGIDKEGDVIR